MRPPLLPPLEPLLVEPELEPELLLDELEVINRLSAPSIEVHPSFKRS
jgi:hypothetical protein